MAEPLSQCSFIVKLWQMLADEVNYETLAWDESGDSFHLRGSSTGMAATLQRYFRHNKLSSFQRQLNYFGFQKTKSQDGSVRYSHKFFHLDRPNDVPKIKRKTNTGAREKMQQKKGKRKASSSVSAPTPSKRQASQLPPPKRFQSPKISPVADSRMSPVQGRIKQLSLRDITNDIKSSSDCSSRRVSAHSRRRRVAEEGGAATVEQADKEDEPQLCNIFLEKEELEDELLQQNFFLGQFGFIKKIQTETEDAVCTMEEDTDQDTDQDKNFIDISLYA